VLYGDADAVWRGRGPLGDGNLQDKRVIFSPNGGIAHIYLKGTNLAWNMHDENNDDEIKSLAEALVRCAVGARSEVPDLNGALGRRVGSENVPVVLARYGGFGESYSWVYWDGNGVQFLSLSEGNGNVNTLLSELQLGDAGDPNSAWPRFMDRIRDMNDARSGDIVLVMNVEDGFLAVDKDERRMNDAHYALPGWHGGPTAGEGWVPLIFGMSAEVDSSFVRKAVPASPLPMWNYQLTPFVGKIVKAARNPDQE
jgi:hypothetical protein